MTMPLLSLDNVTKAYAGVPALRGVDLDHRGGRNPRADGRERRRQVDADQDPRRRRRARHAPTIRIDGTAGQPSTARTRRTGSGFRFIHQELNVVPALSVAENIFIGRRYPRRAGRPRRLARAQRHRARRARRASASPISIRAQQMARLSHGDQMLVRISSAFLGEDGAPARLYVMDEPTAALTRDESERLFARAARDPRRRRLGALRLAPARRGDGALRPRHRAARRPHASTPAGWPTSPMTTSSP